MKLWKYISHSVAQYAMKFFTLLLYHTILSLPHSSICHRGVVGHCVSGDAAAPPYHATVWLWGSGDRRTHLPRHQPHHPCGTSPSINSSEECGCQLLYPREYSTSVCVCISVYFFVCLSTYFLFICSFVYLFCCLSNRGAVFISLSVCMSVCFSLCTYLFTCLIVCLSITTHKNVVVTFVFVTLSFCLFRSVCLFSALYLSTCLYPLIYLPVYYVSITRLSGVKRLWNVWVYGLKE